MDEFDKGNSNVSKLGPVSRIDSSKSSGIKFNVRNGAQAAAKPKNKLFAEDAKTVARHVFETIILNGFKNLLATTAKSAVDYAFFGTSGNPSMRPNGMGQVSYTGFYNRGFNAGTMPTYATPMNQSSTPVVNRQLLYDTSNINDVSFQSKLDAEEMIAGLMDCIARYGNASVADFYDLLNLPHVHTANKYGWRDLSTVSTYTNYDNRTGTIAWYIRFPRIEPLE